VYLSDVLPTAWQSVEYAGIPDGGTVCVLGLGPIGDMATRVALHRGHRVISVDLVPERLARATKRGAEVLDYTQYNGDLGDKLRDMTDGRGPDSVIDSVGMEAHGAPVAKMAHQLVGLLPDAIGEKVMEKAGIDRMGPAADAPPVRQAGAARAWARRTSSAGPPTPAARAGTARVRDLPEEGRCTAYRVYWDREDGLKAFEEASSSATA